MQIARLYRPLDTDAISDIEDEEENLDSTQLLTLHHGQGGAKGKKIRLTDVWDEREELFGVGGDSDDENGFPGDHVRGFRPQQPTGEGPKITLSPPQ